MTLPQVNSPGQVLWLSTWFLLILHIVNYSSCNYVVNVCPLGWSVTALLSEAALLLFTAVPAWSGHPANNF